MSDSFRDAWNEAQANRAPKDVVHTGLTVEVLDKLNAAAGKPATITEPGEVLLDVDGIPNAVGPSTTSTGTIGAVAVSCKQLARLGVELEDARTRWPYLSFI
jgi:hypothetical protein